MWLQIKRNYPEQSNMVTTTNSSGKFSNEVLIERYANNYNLDPATLTIDMVEKHWALEKNLTKKLLESTPNDRKIVFYNAYNTLYNELPWLAKSGSDINTELSEKTFTERWLSILGEIKGKNIYEIGSGNGSLVTFLAKRGGICVGTEITLSRPEKQPQPNLEWHNTDGVNLTQYEPPNFYDLVVSDQLIEHLHPQDIDVHFQNALQILKPGGKYVFITPHYYIGPGDVSRIFGTDEAEGMHLKEYKYYELYELLKTAGFSKIDIPVNIKVGVSVLSQIKMKLFLMLERSLALLPDIGIRKRAFHRLVKPFAVAHEIFIIAHK